MARFENLREWVAVVKTDARSKLKALDLFMRLRERQCQRTEPSYKKPCNPPSKIPTVRETNAYDTVIVNAAIGKLTEQAMPNIHRENGANVPHGIRTACGMDLEPGAQIGRAIQSDNDLPETKGRLQHERRYQDRIPRQGQPSSRIGPDNQTQGHRLASTIPGTPD